MMVRYGHYHFIQLNRYEKKRLDLYTIFFVYYGYMKSQDMIEYIIKKFDGVLIDGYGWEHYIVDGKEYDIRFDPSRIEWACDCKAYQFRRRHKIKYCKHIIEVQDKKFKHRIK